MQHFITPVVLEVQVYVGKFFSLQVQEPLENQPIFKWINQSDAQAVEGDASSGASPNAKHDVVFADEIDDVPHHQEIISKSSVTNNF